MISVKQVNDDSSWFHGQWFIYQQPTADNHDHGAYLWPDGTWQPVACRFIKEHLVLGHAYYDRRVLGHAFYTSQQQAQEILERYKIEETCDTPTLICEKLPVPPQTGN